MTRWAPFEGGRRPWLDPLRFRLWVDEAGGAEFVATEFTFQEQLRFGLAQPGRGARAISASVWFLQVWVPGLSGWRFLQNPRTKELLVVNSTVAGQRGVCRMFFQSARAMVEAAEAASGFALEVVRQHR